ncbi:MAG: hypothetical protein HOV81_26695 [Kofleriaceae bacterium]|nr:hypothetical protein [Kofleriaceae bacterium]
MLLLSIVANQSEKSWQNEVSELLTRAAELCVEHEIDVDPFVRGAYSAYLEAKPGMRERLEELQLIAQLDEMRRLGKIASA